MISSLLAFALRAFLVGAFTFGFVVLFEHGPKGFQAGLPVEWKNFTAFASKFSKPAGMPTPAPEAN